MRRILMPRRLETLDKRPITEAEVVMRLSAYSGLGASAHSCPPQLPATAARSQLPATAARPQLPATAARPQLPAAV